VSGVVIGDKADICEQYGNEAELKVRYSSVALLVNVASWAERSMMMTGTRRETVLVE